MVTLLARVLRCAAAPAVSVKSVARYIRHVFGLWLSRSAIRLVPPGQGGRKQVMGAHRARPPAIAPSADGCPVLRARIARGRAGYRAPAAARLLAAPGPLPRRAQGATPSAPDGGRPR